MIDDEFTSNPPSVAEDDHLDDEALVAECMRLLERMEARIRDFKNTPRKASTGHEVFWPLRGLDEINSLGVTFRKRWTELQIRTPDPPKELHDRAERIVEAFLQAGTRVVVPGEPGEKTRDSLRKLIGLTAPEQ